VLVSVAGGAAVDDVAGAAAGVLIGHDDMAAPGSFCCPWIFRLANVMMRGACNARVAAGLQAAVVRAPRCAVQVLDPVVVATVGHS